MGKVLTSGMTYNIQTCFKMEGYFSIRVTPLEANLCLLEEVEEWDILDIIREGETWWKKWFVEIRRCKKEDVDTERVTWLRLHGVPCHAWNFRFFELMANGIGSYVYYDEDTLKGFNREVAKIIVRTNGVKVLNEIVSVLIDDVCFIIKIAEETHAPLRIRVKQKEGIDETISYSSSDSEDR